MESEKRCEVCNYILTYNVVVWQYEMKTIRGKIMEFPFNVQGEYGERFEENAELPCPFINPDTNLHD